VAKTATVLGSRGSFGDTMRAMRAMILVACAACSFRSPAGSDGQAGAPDGGVDGRGGGDQDGDGVADAIDLCPTLADPQQRDHDGDGRGDVCDRCPALPSTSDPDQDGDGVGDACDPNPTATGDKRILWIGFYPEDAAQLADNSRWQRGGTWSIVDGWVRIDASGVDTLRSTAVVQRAVATSRIRFDDTSPQLTAAGIVSGLVIAGGNLTQFNQCAMFKAQTRIGARSYVTGSQADDFRSWPSAVADGTTVDAAARFAGGMFECSFAAPSTTAAVASGASSGNVELLVQDAVASFDYLFIVESGS
jgi:hypothetical protein